MNKQLTIVCGCVVKDRQILMTQRDEPECPEAHLKWEFPGGKVDFGETPEEACAREIFEETGVKVTIGPLLPKSYETYWNYDWGTQQTLIFVYKCEFISQEERKSDHHIREIAWVKLDEVKNLQTLPAVNEVITEITRLTS